MVLTKSVASFYLFIAFLSLIEALATPASRADFRDETSCINFCFAIDGSASISFRDFDRQRFLAIRIVNSVPLSLNPGFAAVQYGTSNTPIKPLSLLDTDRLSVIGAIGSAVQQKSPGTFITGGINYCFSQLFDVESGRQNCSKSFIVVMGDGNETLGSDPVERSELFKQNGGDVITVAFGPRINRKLLSEIAGNDGFFNANTGNIKNLAQEILTSIGIEGMSATVEV